MVIIKDILGTEHNVGCIACSIQNGEVSLPVERIAETKYFVAEQDFEYSIEGFVIIAAKRHIKSVLEFTNEEQKDFNDFLIKCRKAMKEKLGIDEITIIQEETTSSSHFHVWLFPWLSWMSDYRRKVDNVPKIMELAKREYSNKDNLLKIKESSKKLKEYFSH
jgi:diadenosine tetraphosphate (Ap4A) HIT family hydrolase